MNTKSQVPGQWAQQQQVADERNEKKGSNKRPQRQESSGAKPIREPAKKHGDKIDVRPQGRAKPTTPEDQGGIGAP